MRDPGTAAGGESPLLSVIIPVYNEQATVDTLLRRVVSAPYPDKEIIVVDDGSVDGTVPILERWAATGSVILLRHAQNRGKGAAVRTGLARARGEITLIQDADLEYEPAEYPRLIEVIRRGTGDVVYGSRYLRPAISLPWTGFRLAVSLLNALVRLLYGQRLTDEATCYKAFRTNLLRGLKLQSVRFELCAELTAKVCRSGVRIVEVPVTYRPRTREQGKKIGWRDAWQAVWGLLKWRFLRLPKKQWRSAGARRCLLA